MSAIFIILQWVVYGLVVGLTAKAIHPGKDPVGFFPTIGVGIAGSYVGGLIHWLLVGGDAIQSSGMLLGVLGGVIFLYGYRHWRAAANKSE